MDCELFLTRYSSPFGVLEIGFSSKGLALLIWQENCNRQLALKRIGNRLIKPDADLLTLTISELGDYFGRKLREFTFPVELIGTPFEISVWEAVLGIPYGQTVSYGKLAEAIGMPSGVRAVGSAVGRNPVNIIVPCHRVVGAGNKIGGYAASLEVKRGLLAIEGSLSNRF